MAGEDKQEVKPGELMKPDEGELPARSTYDDFVEGVATRDIAKREGVDQGKSARVFKSVGENGEPTVNLVGRKDIVTELGDVMERGGYRVREWHVRRPDDPVVEGQKVRPALEELLGSVPVPILDNPKEFLEKALKLPLKGAEALDEAARALKEGGFSKSKEGGSEDAKS